MSQRQFFRSMISAAILMQISWSQSKVSSYLVQKHETGPGLTHESLFQEQSTEKSVFWAVVYSAVLPGMGELYAGSFSSGQYFLMADAGLWLSYAGFISHGDWIRNDAKSFATQHANVNLDGKDEDFEVNIGNFLTTDEYNQQKLRNRQIDLLYTDSRYRWQWDSDENRDRFKSMRIRSDEVFRNAKFLIGAAVVNRLVSAFLAGRAAAAHNRRIRYEGAWQLRVSPSGGLLNTHGLELQLSKEF